MSEALVLRFIEIVAALGAMVGYIRGRLNSLAKESDERSIRCDETRERVRKLEEQLAPYYRKETDSQSWEDDDED